jgi:hypothetical protein
LRCIKHESHSLTQNGCYEIPRRGCALYSGVICPGWQCYHPEQLRLCCCSYVRAISKFYLSPYIAYNTILPTALTLFSSEAHTQHVYTHHPKQTTNPIPRSTASGKTATIAKGGKYSEPLKASGNGALKIGKDAGAAYAHGVTQFEYTISDRYWYDISFIDCVNGQDGKKCPGWAGGVKITAQGKDCAVAQCAPGAYCNKGGAYFQPKDDLATKSCGPGSKSGDITMTLCSAKKVAAFAKTRSIAGRLEYEVEAREVEQEVPEVPEVEEVEEEEVDDEE